MNPKRTAIRSEALRQAAKGQECTLNLPGCNYDRETTVMAHIHDETFGGGRKADDTSAVHACSNCHDLIDGRAYRADAPPELIRFHELRALQRTIRRLVLAGVIKVELDPPKVAKPKKRKPRDKRAKMQSRGFGKRIKRKMDGTVESME